MSRAYAEIWRAAAKIVYSHTLRSVNSARTRIESEFRPDEVRQLKEDSAADLTVGGAELAHLAIAHGLVDELHLLLSPVIVGGGKRALPDMRVQLQLLDERRFRSGVVHVRYAIR